MSSHIKNLFYLIVVASILFAQCASDTVINHDEINTINIESYLNNDSLIILKTKTQDIDIFFRNGNIFYTSITDKLTDKKTTIIYNENLDVIQKHVKTKDNFDLNYKYNEYGFCYEIIEYMPSPFNSINQVCRFKNLFHLDSSQALIIKEVNINNYNFYFHSDFYNEWDSVFLYFGKLLTNDDNVTIIDKYKKIHMRNNKAENIYLNKNEFEGGVNFIKIHSDKSISHFWLYFKYPNTF